MPKNLQKKIVKKFTNFFKSKNDKQKFFADTFGKGIYIFLKAFKISIERSCDL